MDEVYQVLQGLGWITIFGLAIIVALVIETGKTNRRKEDNDDVASHRLGSSGIEYGIGHSSIATDVVGPVHIEPKAVESNPDPGVVS